MKKILYLFLSIILFTSCSEDDQNNLNPNATQEVAFGITQKKQSNNVTGEVLTPTKVVVTLKNITADTLVYNKKVLDLFNFNGQYLTQNVTLTVGEYAVEDYFVTDANNQVIYASPKEDSELAQYVNDPLPLSFSVTLDQVSQILPEVLVVGDTYTPEQFGYASFGFNVIDNLKENQIRIEQGGTITTLEGNTLTLPANVIVDQEGNPIPSGIVDVAFTSTNQKRMLSKDFPEMLPQRTQNYQIDPDSIMDDYYYYNAFSVTFFKDGVEVYIDENAHFDISLEGNGSLYPTLDIVSAHKDNSFYIQVDAEATQDNTLYKTSLNNTGNFYLARRVDTMLFDAFDNNLWHFMPDLESDLEVLFANEKIKEAFVTFLNINLRNSNLSINDRITQGHIASIARLRAFAYFPVSHLNLELSNEQNIDYEGLQYFLESSANDDITLNYNNGGITDDDYFLNYIKNIKFSELQSSSFYPDAQGSPRSDYFDLSHNNLTQVVSIYGCNILDMSYNNIQSVTSNDILYYSVLNLSHNQISGDLSKIRMYSSESKPQGFSLDLSYNNISADDLASLNYQKNYQRPINHLNISHNQIAGKLPSNIRFSYPSGTSTSASYNFSHNQITDISVLNDANLVYNNPYGNLIVFDFSYNQITDVTPLENIEVNPTPSSGFSSLTINLTGNPLTEEQVQHLREVLPYAEITF